MEVHTAYFSCFDRKFPWDKQQLLIQLKYDYDAQNFNHTSVLLPSASLGSPGGLVAPRFNDIL
jgi:hypothetical protein